jgi:23S rRNA (cytosine1962-C5)-methyltransferase
MTDNPADRPTVTLLPGHQKRALHGHPWIFSNEVQMDAAAKALAPGSLVTLRTSDGRPLGVATFNPHTLVAARLFDRDAGRRIDREFLAKRLKRALAIRERLYDKPFYRLVHAEADGIPGAVVDRFGGVVVAQLNTAGVTRLEPELLAALETALSPKAIVLRNDSPGRALEGLSEEVRVPLGGLDGAAEVHENGARFEVDLVGGQKTGWFYDQRDNRRFMAKLAKDARVLDLYCFAGGFAIEAAVAGATAVTGIDRSEPALALAARSAALNGVGERCQFRRGEAFAELQTLASAGERFDLVIADPPAFVKSKKEVKQGARAYRKLARLAASLVAPEGFLFIASCSHNMPVEEFDRQVARGLVDASREGRILRAAGAAADHPVHPALPESAYLKSLLLQLD